MADPFHAESACHAVLLGDCVEDGLDHRRGNLDACLASTVASLAEWEQAHRKLAPFLLVLIQPSSQRPRRQPRMQPVRQQCRQVVRDRPVVPSSQEAQQCVIDHPVPQLS